MNLNPITQRIDYLRTAIAYSRYECRIMSVSQGICCNQEIAAWYKVLDGASETPSYTIPQHLDKKVALIHKKIKDTYWEKPRIF